MKRLLLLVQNWTGRITYLPPMDREVRRSRNVTIIVAGLALSWSILQPSQVPWGFGGAVVMMAVGPLLYVRSWPIWNLLVWDSTRMWKTPASQQDANYDAAAEAWMAVAQRRPAEIRAALAKVIDPDPSRAMLVLYYLALADLMERKEPDVSSLAAQLGRLEASRRDTASVMIALVEAGSADLAGGDWRAPLLSCRRELRLRFSPARALWPMHYAYKIIALLMAIAAAEALTR